MKRVAAEEPLHREPKTACRPVLDHGLLRVFRARRREPACRWQDRRDQQTVTADEAGGGAGERAHDRGFEMAANAVRKSPTSVKKGPVRAPGRAITITSTRSGAASRAARYASRSRRRARLRLTAPLIWRLTAKPARRVRPIPHSTMRDGRSIRLPCLKSAWNSALLVNRSWRGNRPAAIPSAVSAPSRAGSLGPYARPSWTCVHESHGSSCAGACSAETSASSGALSLQVVEPQQFRHRVYASQHDRRRDGGGRLLRLTFGVC